MKRTAQPLDASALFRARPCRPRRRRGRTMVEVPLIALAWGRSGDKGNKANIGIIARQPEYLPYICAALTEDVVRAALCPLPRGHVRRQRRALPAARRQRHQFPAARCARRRRRGQHTQRPAGQGLRATVAVLPHSRTSGPRGEPCHDGVSTPGSTSTPRATRKTAARCWNLSSNCRR